MITSNCRSFNDSSCYNFNSDDQMDTSKRLRGGRAASCNIIPSSTGAAKSGRRLFLN
jgi:glyceraldehyde-3-phosphate dehydrogenase/erythrose-4-phosphate dehydrogenase